MEEKTIIKNIKAGDTIALSKAITLCESTLESEQNIAHNIISNLSAKSRESIRIGITGIPGVGKSTFINSFGKMLTNLGKKVAVLAIDPTSEKTHGSILGDKSRMNELTKDKNAFIRPSPSGRTLGTLSFLAFFVLDFLRDFLRDFLLDFLRDFIRDFLRDFL